MSKDMSVPCENGLINLRVGAIIMKDGKLLMAGNRRADYLYSVGGRIRFGETAEEAVVREVYEETGVRMEIDRLGFVNENYFYGDDALNEGKLIYEISFFFYMKVPEDFAPVCFSFTEDGQEEFLRWIAPDSSEKFYPAFFRTELLHPTDGVILSINKTHKHLLQIFSHSFVVSLDRRQPACGFRRALQNSLLISVLILLLLLSIKYFLTDER